MDNITTLSITISNGQSLSAGTYLKGLKPVGMIIPTGFDGTSMTFQVSLDNVTYLNLYNTLGTEEILPLVATSAIPINPWPMFWGWRYIKLRSGTAGTPTTQTGDTTVVLSLVP